MMPMLTEVKQVDPFEKVTFFVKTGLSLFFTAYFDRAIMSFRFSSSMTVTITKSKARDNGYSTCVELRTGSIFLYEFPVDSPASFE